MVDYALKTYNGNSEMVFSTGSSSGAMLTSVLACVYPDVFNAGACFSGVPCACFAGSPSSSPATADPTCANDAKGFSAQQWAQLAANADPGYSGSRTRMQIWHGTADTLVHYGNLWNQLEQWSTLENLSFSYNVSGNPTSQYTKIVYGDGTQLVGYSGAGVPHFVPTFEVPVLEFFGLIPNNSLPVSYTGTASAGISSVTSASTGGSTSTAPSSSPTTTTGSGTGNSGQAQKYGQCGGTDWKGPQSCVSGTTCTVINSYYSQCL
jgi:acetylxylan esterase